MRRLRNQRPGLVLALGGVVVLAVAVLLLSLGGGEKPPATGAAKLVPSDALVYLHVSTDRSRGGVTRALKLAQSFPSYPALRDAVLRRLSSTGQTLDYQRDLAPWVGDEVGLALLNTQGQTAGSLIVVSVRNKGRAQLFLQRAAGGAGTGKYHGTAISRYGSVETAFVGPYLVIGQDASVRRAIDDFAGKAPSLAKNPLYRQANKGLPAGRVMDAWASVAGVRRLLAAQTGLIGAAGTLLDQPALAGTAMALSAASDEARLDVHSVLDPKLKKRLGGQPPEPFSPQLVGTVPKGAMAYIGLTGINRFVRRFLAAGSAGGAQRITALLQRARTDLQSKAGVNLNRDVVPLFRGEVALWIEPAVPAPVLTLIAATKNEAATRLAFSRLQAPLAKLFTPIGTAQGQVPTFTDRFPAGVHAFQLRLAPGIELDYAVFDKKLVISTSLGGIAAVKQAKGSISGADAYTATLGNHPGKVTSLVFLDFSRLLQLGEQTGLNRSSAYRAIRPDLRRIRALGAASSGGEEQTTAQVRLLIR